MKNLLRLLILATLALASASQAETDQSGTTAAAFVKLGQGSRASALGEAYVALADDVAGLAYNPAGLMATQGVSIQATHNEWFEGASAEYLGFKVASGSWGALGFDFGYLVLPTEPINAQIASTGNPFLDFKQTGSFQPFESLASLGYAAALMPGLNLGLALKISSEKIEDSLALGWGIDIGAIYAPEPDGFSYGLSVQNIGPQQTLLTESFGLPLLIRAGGAYRFKETPLLLAAELDVPNDNVLVEALGLEYAVNGILYPRLGYRHDGIFNPWSVGLGFHLGTAKLDIDTTPAGDLGQTYRASLSMDFWGGPAPVAAAKTGQGNPAFRLATLSCDGYSGAGWDLSLELSELDDVVSWAVYVMDSGHPAKLVFRFDGKGVPPVKVSWDGKLANGEDAPDGSYQAALSVVYPQNKRVNSPYIPVQVNRQPPKVSVGIDPSSLDAQDPNKLFVPAKFNVAAQDSTQDAKWTIQVLGPDGKVFQKMTGSTGKDSVVVWDGKGEDGSDYYSNEDYSFKLVVTDSDSGKAYQSSELFKKRCVFRQ